MNPSVILYLKVMNWHGSCFILTNQVYYEIVCDLSCLISYGGWQNCEKRQPALSELSVRFSVLSHGTSRLPLGGLSCNFILGTFIKACRENSCFVKIGQKYQALKNIKDLRTFVIISCWVFRGVRNASENEWSCRKKSRHFTWGAFFFRKLCPLTLNIPRGGSSEDPPWYVIG